MPQQASFKGQRPEAMNFDQKRQTAATFQIQRDINALDQEIKQVDSGGLQMVNIESQHQSKHQE